MSQEQVKAFITLLTVMTTSQKGEDINAASSQLSELIQTPNALFSLLYIFQLPQELHIRKAAAVIFDHALKQGIQASYTQEQNIQMKKAILSIIESDPDFQLRIFLCDLINFENSEILAALLQDIINLARGLCSKSENDFSTTGLYLWSLVSQIMPKESVPDMISELIPISTAALNSDNSTTRVYAAKLLSAVLWRAVDIESEQTIEQIVQLLLTVLHKAFYESQNIQEVHSLIFSITEILDTPTGNFENYEFHFAAFGLEIMRDESLPLALRKEAYNLIENEETDSGCSFALLDYPKSDSPTIEDYFNLFVGIMIQLLNDQREDTSFEFAWKFFHHAGAAIEGDYVYQLIWKIANNLVAGGIIGVQIGLFLIDSIVESNQEFIGENISSIVDYIVQYADVPDQYIEHYAFLLLKELAENVPVWLTTQIDKVVEYIPKHLSHPEALITLDKVLDLSKHPPSNLIEFIRQMLSLGSQANTDQCEMILMCISSSISASYEPIEDIYPDLNTVLQQASSNAELRKAVIHCFGNLAGISPMSMSKDIEAVATLIQEEMKNEDVTVACEAVIALQKICKHLTISLALFSQAFVNQLFTMFGASKTALENFATDEEIQSNIIALQTSVLVCLATFVEGYSTNMPEESKMFYAHLAEMAKYQRMHRWICLCIQISCGGFLLLERNCFPLIISIINENFSQTSDTYLIAKIHNTLIELMLCYGKEITIEYAPKIGREIINEISGIYLEGYLMCELSRSIDIRLIPSIFKCIIQFIDLLGPDINSLMLEETNNQPQQFVEQLKQNIDVYLRSPYKSARGLAIEILAHLAYALPDSKELLGFTYNNIMANIGDKKIDLQESIAKSLRYLLMISPQLFILTRDSFISYSEDIIRRISSGNIDSHSLKYSIIALWCQVIMTFQLTPSVPIFNMVVSALPPPISDESIPVIANFGSYAMRVFPSAQLAQRMPFIAAAVIASEQLILQKMDKAIILEMLERLNAIPVDNFITLVKNDQGALRQLTVNIAKLTAS